jgi:ribosome-binding factor A
MASQRQEKINKELRKLFATFIERESNKESLITVTRCDIAPDLKNVIVYISVLPAEAEESVINFLNRRKWDARDFVKKNLSIRVIPFVEFSIDYGEKNRQHIDQILRDDNLNKSEEA